MENGVTYVLALALGGGVGSMLRASLSALVSRFAHPAWGTLSVNLSGSLLIGVALAWAGAALAYPPPRTVWFDYFAIGVLGGYTTVSSFALQTLQLWQDGRARAACANAAVSVIACPALAALGYGLAVLALGGA